MSYLKRVVSEADAFSNYFLSQSVCRMHAYCQLLRKLLASFLKYYIVKRFVTRCFMWQLVQQEEELRMEEEALYEAKREAARADARKKKMAAAAKKVAQTATKHGKYFSIDDDDSDLEL